MVVFFKILGFLALGLVTDKIKAMICTIGQEPHPTSSGKYRWVIPVEDPCQCTKVKVGGVYTHAPHRPFKVTYYDTLLKSDDPEEIQDWLNCDGGVFVCSREVEGPLGMENGHIPNASLSASSVHLGAVEICGPQRARLNIEGIAAAWCCNRDTDPDPWIQVDFQTKVYITGLITQGRGDIGQWVTDYQVEYSEGGHQSWRSVTDKLDGPPTTFPGNTDKNSLVTARFHDVLHARFIRILLINWNNFCSMRFEVIGCYNSK